MGDRFGRGGRCYAEGSTLLVRGRGWAPRSVVRFGKARLRTDRSGGFAVLVEADAQGKAQRRVTLQFRQTVRSAPERARARRFALRVWMGLQGVDVPSWSGDDVAVGVPGRVERARAGGFDWAIGGSLYVHYVRAGQPAFGQRVARLRGPCGAAKFNLTQFPFEPVPPGVYRVHFGTDPSGAARAGGGYPAVRVGPPPVPSVFQPAALFTVAGNARRAPLGEGGPATAAGMRPGGSVAALPDGGFLVTDGARVRRVEPTGRIVTVAGTGRYGSTGDGGPATAARVAPRDVSLLPDGSVLIADCDAARIRRVAPDGIISTVAGNGRHGFRGDGGPATSARLQCPHAIAAMPDGSIAVADSDRVRRVGPDGIIATIAGTGEFPDEPADGPALSGAVSPSDLAALPDGTLLVADDWVHRVYRLAAGVLTTVAGDGSEGLRRDDGVPATDAAVSAAAVAAAPSGGFFVADHGFSAATGSQPRLRFVDTDGTIFTLAGTGRFAPLPTRADELRGDGMPPQQADLRHIYDIAALPGGGIVFTEGPSEGRRQPGLVRYLPPPSGGLLAVAVRRDRDRIFAPEAPASITVALTGPADVTLALSWGDATGTTFTHRLPAGESRIDLGALADRPHTITVTARDAAGRVASDRAAILPRGWLTTRLGRTIAEGVIFTATDASSISGSGLRGCRRLAPNRIDCRLSPGGSRCRLVVTVRLGADGRLRWGAYPCPLRSTSRLTRPLTPLRRRHMSCEFSDVDCPPDLFGIVEDRWLVPWD